ncbi:hypothetical protein BHM03_00053500 [Ensete ventricosum]|nr:hypothetical protein BHM03_00053500 [Ensete ventricosum]
MGPSHDYYGRGGPSMPSAAADLCRLNLTSDGAGPHHGWFCDYVEVTLPPLRHRRRLRPVQSHRRADPPPPCGRRWLPQALIILLVSECPLWRTEMLCLSCGVGIAQQ